MQTKIYYTIDQTAQGWPTGPWGGEPDKVQWPDTSTSLPCLAVRNPILGYWCGYVGMPPGHPLHGTYHDADNLDVNVHGGLIFSGESDPRRDETRDICHIPATGEPDDIWWFGFNCAHDFDTCPGSPSSRWILGDGFYRTLHYVQQQCARLAAQLDQDMQPAL